MSAEGSRASCRAAAVVMAAAGRAVRDGATTLDVEASAVEAMLSLGVRSAFLGYHGFPGEICVSVNDEVLHGIPSRGRRISMGDVVKVDLGVVKDGFYSDMAQTFLLDDGSETFRAKRLLSDATLSALCAGMGLARTGLSVRDISTAISGVLAAKGYRPVEGMAGHGVGVRLHEPPQVPNQVEGWDCSAVLRKGMVLALEPMAGMGSPKVRIRNDGWTIAMEDGMPSAHFEHTVLVTDGEPEVLTV